MTPSTPLDNSLLSFIGGLGAPLNGSSMHGVRGRATAVGRVMGTLSPQATTGGPGAKLGGRPPAWAERGQVGDPSVNGVRGRRGHSETQALEPGGQALGRDEREQRGPVLPLQPGAATGGKCARQRHPRELARETAALPHSNALPGNDPEADIADCADYVIRLGQRDIGSSEANRGDPLERHGEVQGPRSRSPPQNSNGFERPLLAAQGGALPPHLIRPPELSKAADGQVVDPPLVGGRRHRTRRGPPTSGGST